MPVKLRRQESGAWLEKGSKGLLKLSGKTLLTANSARKAVGNLRDHGPVLVRDVAL